MNEDTNGDFELKHATFTVIRESRPDGGLRVSSKDLPGLILSSLDVAGVNADIPKAAKALCEHAGLNVEGVFETEDPERYFLIYRQPVHHTGASRP